MSRTHTNTSALRRLLQQELALGQRMVALTEEETEALVESRVERLAALQEERSLCLVQQTSLESARLAATRELAFALDFDRQPTLSELLPKLPAREQDALNRLRVQILETEGRLAILTQRNRLLIENALDFVRFSLEALTAAALQPARYGTNVARIANPAFYIDSKA